MIDINKLEGEAFEAYGHGVCAGYEDGYLAALKNVWSALKENYSIDCDLDEVFWSYFDISGALDVASIRPGTNVALRWKEFLEDETEEKTDIYWDADPSYTTKLG